MAMVDGGLTSNIPADAARLMGCDIVIAVNFARAPCEEQDQMNAPWEIADQIMTIMMQESNRRQLKFAMWSSRPVIRPHGLRFLRVIVSSLRVNVPEKKIFHAS